MAATMETIWAFLSDATNRETLAWIGGGAATVASAIWIAFKHFANDKNQDKPSRKSGATSAAAGQGLASSGDMLVEGGVHIESHSGPTKWAYALGALGLVILGYAAVFSQGDTCLVNALSVGGEVSGTVTVVGGSGDVACD